MIPTQKCTKYSLFALLIFCFVGASMLFFSQPKADDAANKAIHTQALAIPKTITFETETIAIETKAGKTFDFVVELAKTPAQQQRGLMYRTELAQESGMLFLFNTAGMRSFWMKNTLIPLDILFLNHNGTIQHIHHNAKPQDLTSISSKQPAKAVLELNAGASDRMGIQEGDLIVHPFFKNTTTQHYKASPAKRK